MEDAVARLRQNAALIQARHPTPRGVEWQPRAQCAPTDDDRPPPDEDVDTWRWCRYIWGSDPHAVQFDVVDYLLHGADHRDETEPSLALLAPLLRDMVLAELPVPSKPDEYARLVAQLIDGIQSTPVPTPADDPPLRLPRDTRMQRTVGFQTRASQPMSGSRVAAVGSRSRADGAVRSARLHGLTTPSGTYTVPGAGARPRVLQVYQQSVRVRKPLET